MPLAAKKLRERDMEYEYDDTEGKGVFLDSLGETVYCPEHCKVFPLGSGEAFLDVEGDDANHTWFVSGVPELDSMQEGAVLTAGQVLGRAGQDLLLGLEMYPKDGSRPFNVDPLTTLQSGQAEFIDQDSGSHELQSGAKGGDIVPATVQVDPNTLAATSPSEIFKSKPQYTAFDMMIVIGVTASLTGLVTYGLTRGRRMR